MDYVIHLAYLRKSNQAAGRIRAARWDPRFRPRLRSVIKCTNDDPDDSKALIAIGDTVKFAANYLTE